MKDVHTDREDAPFKIGDVVRRINSSHGGFLEGQEDEVVGFRLEDGRFFRVLLKRSATYGHDAKNLQLVRSKEAKVINNYPIY